jgi:SAM-dependent methyltransferase
MSFSSYFSKQAKNPSGLFGRFVMSVFFDIGNAKLNNFVYEILSIEKDEKLLEIGSGTGKLTKKILKEIDKGFVESVDFSEAMVSVSRRRNKSYINKGKANIKKGDFNEIPFKDNAFNKVFTVNTIYFLEDPYIMIKKIYKILKPEGRLVIGFEQNNYMKDNRLDNEVFNYYSPEDIEKMLKGSGFNNIVTESIVNRSTVLYCMAATK